MSATAAAAAAAGVNNLSPCPSQHQLLAGSAVLSGDVMARYWRRPAGSLPQQQSRHAPT